MASFGWKRKVGEKVSKSVVEQFEAQSEKSKDGRPRQEQEVDWLHAIKRKREVLLDDCSEKSRALKEEGTQLVEQGRHWEAVKKWDEAIQLTPDNSELYEMKSQVLTILKEEFPAVKAAEMAVKFRPVWWEGWQTLGRAQLNMGEVDLAVRSFQVAIHLCPSERSLWQDDLAWASKVQRQHRVKVRQESEDETHAAATAASDPELEQDFDFESDEVLLACEAVAERQTRREELRRSALVMDREGHVTSVLAGEEDPETISEEQFVKARTH